MKNVLAGVVLAAALSMGTTGADAKGCIKGALVGGLGGHMAHHGLMGAAAGCAVGHHLASRRAKAAAAQDDAR